MLSHGALVDEDNFVHISLKKVNVILPMIGKNYVGFTESIYFLVIMS